MEMQSKPGPNGTPATFPSPSPGMAEAPSNPVRILGIIVRGLAIILTLIATILMGVAKQTKTFVQTDDYNNSTVVTGTVKSSYSSAYKYFIAANAITFFLSSVSFVASIINRSSFGNLPLFSIIDIIAVAFLFSCNGAAAAITMVAKHGIENLGWVKICDIGGKFCDMVTAAIVLSMIASLAYVLLLLLAILGSHKRSQ